MQALLYAALASLGVYFLSILAKSECPFSPFLETFYSSCCFVFRVCRLRGFRRGPIRVTPCLFSLPLSHNSLHSHRIVVHFFPLLLFRVSLTFRELEHRLDDASGTPLCVDGDLYTSRSLKLWRLSSQQVRVFTQEDYITHAHPNVASVSSVQT